jgi:hypothetical protein
MWIAVRSNISIPIEAVCRSFQTLYIGVVAAGKVTLYGKRSALNVRFN